MGQITSEFALGRAILLKMNYPFALNTRNLKSDFMDDVMIHDVTASHHSIRELRDVKTEPDSIPD
jgi:hypothetical protein